MRLTPAAKQMFSPEIQSPYKCAECELNIDCVDIQSSKKSYGLLEIGSELVGVSCACRILINIGTKTALVLEAFVKTGR